MSIPVRTRYEPCIDAVSVKGVAGARRAVEGGLGTDRLAAYTAFVGAIATVVLYPDLDTSCGSHSDACSSWVAGCLGHVCVHLSELSDAQSEDRSQATNLLTQVHRGP
jgi:hypothetical protein